MVISSRHKLQSLNDYTMNIHIDGVPIKQSNQSKSLRLIIDENLSWKAHIHETSKKVSSGIGLLSGSGHLFQCTLQLKYTKVLLSHTLIIATLYGMAWPNSLVRNFKNFKIVLSESSPNLATLRLNLLALSQRSIYFRSLLIWDSRSGIVAAEKVTLVSSAYILEEPTFKQFGRSFI